MIQAAEWFGCAQTTVQDWYDAGHLNGFRTGGREELDEFGRPGTRGARRIARDDKAWALREVHRARQEAKRTPHKEAPAE